ncbi:CDP-glycerol glycerophosphotransferase family protein [Selenomonas ruminantium]|uniref:CDP-Glycerol:Poly(Glycerophosphate) glycerophosphotransferase n=1 Tax=Selenomonas ruminantium TaxID=971 RepID=A0A1H0TYL3_SELRU|nr:CDP-glycerol glycerophosphotransferase family protein [Selenomonas ruminantium]SDP58855.1 CDP-Glycerol:Poly(glycerophosphate) glycerophosphotransferase [Selenomonas ruminantium]
MRRVIIFYELISREYDVCRKIKKKIEEMGGEAYVFSITFEWYDAVVLSKKTKIDFVLMPWMYTDHNYELVQPFIENNPNVKLGNFHHEEISSPAYESVLLPKSENAKNSMLHFVWTGTFAESLRLCGVKKENIFVIGNPRCDEGRTVNKTRLDLSQEYKLNVDKKWILYAETRDASPKLLASNKRDLLGLGITEAVYNQAVKYDVESLKKTIEQLHCLPDEFFDEYEIIYRPHPGHRANASIDQRVHVITDYSIYEWLNVAELYVTWQSTSIFESDLMGVVSFLHEPVNREDRFRVRGLVEYPKIIDLSDLIHVNIESAKSSQNRKMTYKKYLGECDGKSVRNVAEKVIDLIELPPQNYKVNYIGIRKYRLWKERIYEIITRVFVKLNILQHLHYPNTSYLRIRDIPYKKGNL